jgi:hypothetical protein
MSNRKIVLRLGTQEVVGEPMKKSVASSPFYAMEAETLDQRLDAYGKRDVIARREGDRLSLTAHGRRVTVPKP